VWGIGDNVWGVGVWDVGYRREWDLRYNRDRQRVTWEKGTCTHELLAHLLQMFCHKACSQGLGSQSGWWCSAPEQEIIEHVQLQTRELTNQLDECIQCPDIK